MLIFFVAVAEQVLNQCVESNINECGYESIGFHVSYNYEFIEDFQECVPFTFLIVISLIIYYRDWFPDKQYVKDNHPLALMVICL